MPPASRKKKKSKALVIGAAAGLNVDPELFERLRSLCELIAAKLGVPPYVVFHDTALVEMAALKPLTTDSLREVKGIGERKLERYGTAFIRVIAGEAAEAACELF